MNNYSPSGTAALGRPKSVFGLSGIWRRLFGFSTYNLISPEKAFEADSRKESAENAAEDDYSYPIGALI